MEKAEGFVQKMGALSPGEDATSILKPYGVFAAIEPFNFPMALAAGAIAAAMVAGNTVVMKIASTTPWTAQNLYESFRDAGLPEGVLQLIQGSGSKIGKALSEHKLTKGIVFTGSYDVGMGLIRNFGVGGRYVKPCIVEMGGKNPGIVCKSADIDKAVTATWKSGFGMTGQKCSELSRIYVHKDIADEFRTKLVDAVNNLVIGDPTKKETFIGPVIDERAYKKYEVAMEKATMNGGKILCGGHTLRSKPEFAHGYFVEPTIIEANHDHPLTKEELFLPVLMFYTFDTIEEVIEKANDVDYGLTAGIFSRDEQEIQYFLDNIEAGVTYCNRPTGITTGAWPGVNPFCGWKGSGGSGKGFCGPYYVSQFMREQSQTKHPY
jgi:1-pyrroline-5-carboxylate dehydrogenase